MADKKEELLKALKSLAPGDLMVFVAEQTGMSPAEFLAKNAGRIALKAVKSGWVKAGGIKDAVKDFSAKNAEDSTGINWDDVEIDETAVKLACLFDRDSGEKLKKFVKDLSAKMAEFAEKETEEGDDAEEGMNESSVDEASGNKIEKSMKAGGTFRGLNFENAVKKATKELGSDEDSVAELFAVSKSSNSINRAGKKVILNLKAFAVQYDKDPDLAVKGLLAAKNGP